MIDYKDLADNDPGGDLDAAFAWMRDQTQAVNRDYPVTYVIVAREVGADVADALQERVETLTTAGALKKWVNEALETEGINVNDPQVASRIDAMVDGVTFTQSDADAIVAIASQTVQRWPGLRPGYLQDARRKRAEGLI